MSPEDLKEWRDRLVSRLDLRLAPPLAATWEPSTQRHDVMVCAGGACVSLGSANVAAAFRELLGQRRLAGQVHLVETGCVGCCNLGVVIQVCPDDVLYARVRPDQVRRIVEEHLRGGRVVSELLHHDDGNTYRSAREMPFFVRQQRVVLENCGLIDPQSLEEYVARDGYAALSRALTEMSPADVVAEVSRSGLRGRGGGGFPTGAKWKMLAAAPGACKYVVCNADEGDPGAFMDRSVLESDPHRVLEGMLIAGFATGSRHGVVYVRAEYPLAIRRLQQALAAAEEQGFLGLRILDTAFSFEVEIRVGAGAFVCGEETALMASVEGRRGSPRPRPPFPTESGLFGHPTAINNVETFANVPPILRRGAEWFRSLGTPDSPGTKVFALAGSITNTGLVEVPMGTSLRDLVFEVGGGVRGGRAFKAAQTGGPSGGCIPARHLDTPLDFDSLQRIGSIMGSGGLIVMDETSCMVDVARFFMDFCVEESCGKCPPCRAGTRQMLHLLDRVCAGRADPGDLARLEELGETMTTASLCGLGTTAPNPVRSTLRHFREEYVAHVQDGRCHAGVCRALFRSPCENACPLRMNIPGFLQLLNEGRLDDAYEMILLENPLPATTGRVCQHPCQQRCARGNHDEPVAIRDVHRFIADTIHAEGREGRLLGRVKDRRLPATGKRVAVVGAGPAGLTAAFYLALLGHRVSLYDGAPEPGGLLRFGLAAYRLPRMVLRAELAFLRVLGIEVVVNASLGAELCLARLEHDFDAVLLALGTAKQVRAGVPGAELGGVRDALDFLVSCSVGRPPQLGDHVVVVGGGNAAVDAARTARRLGARVTVAYRRQQADMPAIPEEVEQAREEGVELLFHTGVSAIVGVEGLVKAIAAERLAPGRYDSSGRRSPEPTGEVRELPCSGVIFAIGERVDPQPLQAAGIELDPTGRVRVDLATGQTSRPRVFAAGDVVTGPSNVALAMAAGKRAVERIDAALSGSSRLISMTSGFSYAQTAPTRAVGGERSRVKMLALEQREGSFGEVSLGLTEVQARSEARRCLRCDVSDQAQEEDAVAARAGA